MTAYRRPGPYVPRQMSYSQRWASRGGSTVFSDLGPPVDATPAQLLAWAQEAQRRAGLIILACQAARLQRQDGFYHPLTGKVGDVDLHLASAQCRQMAAATLMERARADG
jgi:hypothetical protein